MNVTRILFQTIGTCNFVECAYGPWSAWTTTCGAGERARKLVATQKTEKKASCDGLLQECSKTPDVVKRTTMCKIISLSSFIAPSFFATFLYHLSLPLLSLYSFLYHLSLLFLPLFFLSFPPSLHLLYFFIFLHHLPWSFLSLFFNYCYHSFFHLHYPN